jgi:hypothetical protein
MISQTEVILLQVKALVRLLITFKNNFYETYFCFSDGGPGAAQCLQLLKQWFPVIFNKVNKYGKEKHMDTVRGKGGGV